MSSENRAWLLIEGEVALGAIFDEQLAIDIADVFEFTIEEVEYVDEVN